MPSKKIDKPTEEGTPFDEWFYLVKYFLKDQGFTGEVNEKDFKMDYYNGATCYSAAINFISKRIDKTTIK